MECGRRWIDGWGRCRDTKHHLTRGAGGTLGASCVIFLQRKSKAWGSGGSSIGEGGSLDSVCADLRPLRPRRRVLWVAVSPPPCEPPDETRFKNAWCAGVPKEGSTTLEVSLQNQFALQGHWSWCRCLHGVDHIQETFSSFRLHRGQTGARTHECDRILTHSNRASRGRCRSPSADTTRRDSTWAVCWQDFSCWQGGAFFTQSDEISPDSCKIVLDGKHTPQHRGGRLIFRTANRSGTRIWFGEPDGYFNLKN